MNLKDIAREAGVAVSTVSRVLNGKDKCATEVVQNKIWEIVRREGYTPNKIAQQLKMPSKATKASKIFIMFARAKSRSDNEFFNLLATSIERETLRQSGVLGGRFFVNELTSEISDDIEVGSFDGLIVLGRSNGEPSYFVEKFKSRVVFVTLIPIEVSHDQVRCDGKKAAEIALSYLLQKGHRKIAYVGEKYNEGRYNAYRDFLYGKSLSSRSEYEIDTTMTEEGGATAVKQFLQIEDRPTAIFCANDVTAMGLLKELRKRGIKVPDQVSVISIDNIIKSDSCVPPLTTVNVPIEEMGVCAAKLLFDRINKGHKTKMEVFLPAELLVRESVKNIPLL